MIELGAYRLDLIGDGSFEDEADTFVRHCAEREHKPGVRVRGKRRIRVGFNSLLVRGAGRCVVIDPGTGDKLREDLVAQYRMEWPRRFLPTIAELGVLREDVDTVILTHLHWDHAGAATRIGAEGEIVPTFPNARYFVQRRELEAARRSDDGYIADDFEPLARRGQLELVDGEAEILPGFEVRWTGGHTAGHQVVLIGDPPRVRAAFLSDLVPTATQLPLDCGLSYDVNADELRAAKERILGEAADQNYLLMFVHAPKLRAGYLNRTTGGGFRLTSVDV
ncbi:MBL fold metallo-hydrolase [bacterium]|nr:MBL fold metallo-hydrolase [bacterium]MBU1983256.1 MBL fold metallo-hydrolase [bacterium]